MLNRKTYPWIYSDKEDVEEAGKKTGKMKRTRATRVRIGVPRRLENPSPRRLLTPKETVATGRNGMKMMVHCWETTPGCHRLAGTTECMGGMGRTVSSTISLPVRTE